AIFSDDKMLLTLDRGTYSSVSRQPDYLEFREQRIVIGGKTGRLATYRDPTSGNKMPWAARIYVVTGPKPEKGFGNMAMNMFVHSESAEGIEIAKQIFRSIKFEK